MVQHRLATLIAAVSLSVVAGCASSATTEARSPTPTVSDAADTAVAVAVRSEDSQGRPHFTMPSDQSDRYAVMLMAFGDGVVHVGDQRLAVGCGSTVQLPVGVPYMVEGTEVDSIVVENE